jgi:hypothetical protein
VCRDATAAVVDVPVHGRPPVDLRRQTGGVRRPVRARRRRTHDPRPSGRATSRASISFAWIIGPDVLAFELLGDGAADPWFTATWESEVDQVIG